MRMNKPLLNIYHQLPPSLQDLAASVHGLGLRRERYGEETDALVIGALERDQWDPARWRHWQQERLAFVLHRAATRVPYYREMWARRRRQGDARPWDRLEYWPVLEKEELRRYGPSFIADDQSPRDMTVERTSGTTGTPLTLWRSRRASRARFAHYEARRLRWNAVDRHDRWAILGGQLVTPYSRSRPPFWVWNRPLRQLYLSSYHLAPSFVLAYVEALADYQIQYLIGYPSSIDSIARAAGLGGVSLLKLKAVITVAEPLYAHQREAIETAFGCPVRETYGMAELTAAASECGEGRLHQWPEFGVCEIGDSDGNTSRQGAGELIATSLLDVDMPLIRYRVGDRIAMGEGDRLCPCGRALPLLDSVDGRCDDLLQTRDGRLVGRLDPVFKAGLGVREAQVIQESLDRIRVLLVPGEGFGAEDELAIRRALRDRLGDVRVSLECVAAIPRGRNGKFRAVISRVSPRPEVEEAPLKQTAAGAG